MYELTATHRRLPDGPGAGGGRPAQDSALEALVAAELEALVARARRDDAREEPLVRSPPIEPTTVPDVPVAPLAAAPAVDRTLAVVVVVTGGLIFGLSGLAAWLATHRPVVFVPASSPRAAAAPTHPKAPVSEAPSPPVAPPPSRAPVEPAAKGGAETAVAAPTALGSQPPAVARPARRRTGPPPPRPPPSPRPSAEPDTFESVFGVPPSEPPAAPPAVFIPPAPGRGAPPRERLTDQDVREVVHESRGRLVLCADQPGARGAGKLAVRWTIEPSGETSGISTESPRLRGSVLASCVAQVIRTLRFPRAAARREPVTYSFTF